MNKICSAATALLISIAATAGCAMMSQPAAPDGAPGISGSARGNDPGQIVAAKVNGSVITMDALVKMMNRLGPAPENGSAEALEPVKRSALDQLILQELAYQQAKKQDIGIDPKSIDAAIGNFRENAGGEREYRALLEKQGRSETELRAEVERRLLLGRIFSLEVAEKSIVPDDVLRQEYEREKKRFVIPEKLSVTDVFFVKNGRPGMVKRAKDTRKKILADPGRDPWKLVLDGTFIVRSMDLNQKQPELYRAAKKLKPGELSGIVGAGDGLHILSVKTISPERQLSFDEVKKTLEGRFRIPAQQKRLREWEAELKQAAVIEINEQAVHPAGELKGGTESVRNN